MKSWFKYLIIGVLLIANKIYAQDINFIQITNTINDSTSNNEKAIEYLYTSNPPFITKTDSLFPYNYKNQLTKKSDFSLQVGAEFGTSFHNSFFTSQYIAPSIKKNLNKRISVIGGVKYTFNYFSDYNIFNRKLELRPVSGNTNSVGAFGSLIYKLNNKTDLLTSAIVEHSLFTLENAQQFNKTFNELAIGINYKITPNFSFGAQVSFGNKLFSNGMYLPNTYQMAPGFGF